MTAKFERPRGGDVWAGGFGQNLRFAVSPLRAPGIHLYRRRGTRERSSLKHGHRRKSSGSLASMYITASPGASHPHEDSGTHSPTSESEVEYGTSRPSSVASHAHKHDPAKARKISAAGARFLGRFRYLFEFLCFSLSQARAIAEASSSSTSLAAASSFASRLAHVHPAHTVRRQDYSLRAAQAPTGPVSDAALAYTLALLGAELEHNQTPSSVIRAVLSACVGWPLFDEDDDGDGSVMGYAAAVATTSGDVIPFLSSRQKLARLLRLWLTEEQQVHTLRSLLMCPLPAIPGAAPIQAYTVVKIGRGVSSRPAESAVAAAVEEEEDDGHPRRNLWTRNRSFRTQQAKNDNESIGSGRRRLTPALALEYSLNALLSLAMGQPYGALAGDDEAGAADTGGGGDSLGRAIVDKRPSTVLLLQRAARKGGMMLHCEASDSDEPQVMESGALGILARRASAPRNVARESVPRSLSEGAISSTAIDVTPSVVGTSKPASVTEECANPVLELSLSLVRYGGVALLSPPALQAFVTASQTSGDAGTSYTIGSIIDAICRPAPRSKVCIQLWQKWRNATDQRMRSFIRRSNRDRAIRSLASPDSSPPDSSPLAVAGESPDTLISESLDVRGFAYGHSPDSKHSRLAFAALWPGVGTLPTPSNADLPAIPTRGVSGEYSSCPATSAPLKVSTSMVSFANVLADDDNDDHLDVTGVSSPPDTTYESQPPPEHRIPNFTALAARRGMARSASDSGLAAVATDDGLSTAWVEQPPETQVHESRVPFSMPLRPLNESGGSVPTLALAIDTVAAADAGSSPPQMLPHRPRRKNSSGSPEGLASPGRSVSVPRARASSRDTPDPLADLFSPTPTIEKHISTGSPDRVGPQRSIDDDSGSTPSRAATARIASEAPVVSLHAVESWLPRQEASTQSVDAEFRDACRDTVVASVANALVKRVRVTSLSVAYALSAECRIPLQLLRMEGAPSPVELEDADAMAAESAIDDALAVAAAASSNGASPHFEIRSFDGRDDASHISARPFTPAPARVTDVSLLSGSPFEGVLSPIVESPPSTSHQESPPIAGVGAFRSGHSLFDVFSTPPIVRTVKPDFREDKEVSSSSSDTEESEQLHSYLTPAEAAIAATAVTEATKAGGWQSPFRRARLDSAALSSLSGRGGGIDSDTGVLVKPYSGAASGSLKILLEVAERSVTRFSGTAEDDRMTRAAKATKGSSVSRAGRSASSSVATVTLGPSVISFTSPEAPSLPEAAQRAAAIVYKAGGGFIASKEDTLTRPREHLAQALERPDASEPQRPSFGHRAGPSAARQPRHPSPLARGLGNNNAAVGMASLFELSASLPPPTPPATASPTNVVESSLLPSQQAMHHSKSAKLLLSKTYSAIGPAKLVESVGHLLVRLSPTVCGEYGLILSTAASIAQADSSAARALCDTVLRRWPRMDTTRAMLLLKFLVAASAGWQRPDLPDVSPKDLAESPMASRVRPMTAEDVTESECLGQGHLSSRAPPSHPPRDNKPSPVPIRPEDETDAGVFSAERLALFSARVELRAAVIRRVCSCLESTHIQLATTAAGLCHPFPAGGGAANPLVQTIITSRPILLRVIKSLASPAVNSHWNPTITKNARIVSRGLAALALRGGLVSREDIAATVAQARGDQQSQ
jgi:hypothetical protein